MAGVVTYDLEPPLQLVTSSSLVVAIDNRSLYSVVLFWRERRKTNMAGVVTYDTALTQ
jgi:hypothetical protein